MNVLNSVQDGIMALAAVRDAQGRIEDFVWRMINPRAEAVIGRPAAELLGRRMTEELPGTLEAGLFEACAEVVDTGRPFQQEFQRDRDEGPQWFRVSVFKLEDGVTVTFYDVTERIRAERALEQANAELRRRNQALQDFAYVASHDLQEPLRKVRAFAGLMREDYAEAVDETGQYYLERMQDAAARMARLISDLLRFSRITTRTRPFERVDLGAVVHAVCADLEVSTEEAGAQVEVEGALPTLDADATQMRRLFQNLISNAVKFRKEDAPPVLRIAAAPVAPEGTDAEPRCRITVRDNGIGFEEKYLDRIFTPFQRLWSQSEYAGTGMGLAICRRIAERHRGALAARSTPGEGSTFIITLPLHQPDIENTP